MGLGFNFDNTKFTEILENSGLKSKWIAEKVGISPASICKYKSGDRNPSLPVAKLLALTLGVELGDFQKKKAA